MGSSVRSKMCATNGRTSHGGVAVAEGSLSLSSEGDPLFLFCSGFSCSGVLYTAAPSPRHMAIRAAASWYGSYPRSLASQPKQFSQQRSVVSLSTKQYSTLLVPIAALSAGRSDALHRSSWQASLLPNLNAHLVLARAQASLSSGTIAPLTTDQQFCWFPP